MKRMLALLVTALLLCQVPLALADTWYCPQCGRLNDNNFCPADGTARPIDVQPQTQISGNYTQYAYVTATLSMKMATRTGPSTQYDEPGSFLSAGKKVTVLSKAYDDRNEIWWVQVEFKESGSTYRAYTGIKRFSDLNLNQIPEEKLIGRCTLSQSITGYYGPGYKYRAIKENIPSGAECDIYGYAYGGDSDFIQIEFYDQSQKCARRAWIPDWYADNYVMYYGF